MRVVYRKLFRVRVRHGYYAQGEPPGDFVIEPTPSSRRLLDSLGLRTRGYPDGLVVFGEVEPGSAPPTLARPIGRNPLRLAFQLRAANTLVGSFSALPAHRPAREVFCFDNLQEDVADGRKHLGDGVAGTRLGTPVELVVRPTYSYRFAAPVNSAQLSLQDRFGNSIATIAMTLPAAATSKEHRIDLAAIDRMIPGRYRLSDDHGGSASFYYDPELENLRPLGVIEIYSRTNEFTSTAADLVPAAYRFLNGDEISGLDAYYLQFEARATTWRYAVIKKYDNSNVNLNQLSISGPVNFGKTPSQGRVTFTSTAAVHLSDTTRGLKLKEGNKEIRALPDPDASTPLAEGASAGSFISNLFIYV